MITQIKKDLPPAKTHRVTIRLTDVQYELITRRAEELNMSVAEYIRHQAVHGEVHVHYQVVADLPDIQKLVVQFSAIGNNLNQTEGSFRQ